MSNLAPEPNPSGVPVVGKLADAARPPEPAAQQQIGTYPRVARVAGNLAVSATGGTGCSPVAERITVTSPTTATIVLGTPGYKPGDACAADLIVTRSVVTVPGLDYNAALRIAVDEDNLTSTARLPRI